jgi:hypothetical protein
VLLFAPAAVHRVTKLLRPFIAARGVWSARPVIGRDPPKSGPTLTSARLVAAMLI